MPATGYIQVHAYSSFAQLPLQDVAVTITALDGTALAMQLTDRSGRITPIAVPVPDLSASQTPDTGQVPSPPLTCRQDARITNRSTSNGCRSLPTPPQIRILK